MFDSPSSIMLFSVFPAFFIFRLAKLSENEDFCNLIDYLNKKLQQIFFLTVTLCCSLFTLFLVQSHQTNLMENPVSLGIIYFLDFNSIKFACV